MSKKLKKVKKVKRWGEKILKSREKVILKDLVLLRDVQEIIARNAEFLMDLMEKEAFRAQHHKEDGFVDRLLLAHANSEVTIQEDKSPLERRVNSLFDL